MAKQRTERNTEARITTEENQARPKQAVKPERVIPVVTARYRVTLSEGVKPSNDSAISKIKKE